MSLTDHTYSPAVENHMTFGELVKTLSALPRNAVLYSQERVSDTGEKSFVYPIPNVSHYQEWDVSLFSLEYPVPFRVGKFLYYLTQRRGQNFYFQSPGKVVDECYVWLDKPFGAVVGIVSNDDGTFTFAVEDPTG